MSVSTEKLSPQLLEPVYHSRELIVQGFIKFNRSVAVVVAQLVERSLPTPEIGGLNPNIGKDCLPIVN